MSICSKCKEEKEVYHLENIDSKFICHSCLYNKYKPFKIYPIGFVEKEMEQDNEFGSKNNQNEISKINLFKSQKSFLYRLEDEKWVTIVYYFHKQKQVHSIFNRGLDGKKVGIFASRTPKRLSRIGISAVKLLRIDDTTLYVENLDAINETPVLDIKMGKKS